MTIKQLIVTALVALVVVYVLLLMAMTPLQTTSGSGEGNILTTQRP